MPPKVGKQEYMFGFATFGLKFALEEERKLFVFGWVLIEKFIRLTKLKPTVLHIGALEQSLKPECQHSASHDPESGRGSIDPMPT